MEMKNISGRNDQYGFQKVK